MPTFVKPGPFNVIRTGETGGDRPDRGRRERRGGPEPRTIPTIAGGSRLLSSRRRCRKAQALYPRKMRIEGPDLTVGPAAGSCGLQRREEIARHREGLPAERSGPAQQRAAIGACT